MTSAQKIRANRANARASTARRPLLAALARRETRFATRSAFPFVPIPNCPKRLKRSRAKLPGPARALKFKSSRVELPKPRSTCDASAVLDIS